MTSVDVDPFYQVSERRGEGTVLKKKHIRQYRRDFVEASAFTHGMSVLELGCGNGLFLKFLKYIGVTDFLGVDGDSRVRDDIPPELAAHLAIADFETFFRDAAGRRFDRIVLFDVLEHFALDDAIAMLVKIGDLLAPGGRVVIRVPNMASPFALPIHFGDITHRAAFTPASIRQVARVADYEALAVRPQSYSTALKEIREKVLTRAIGWFLAAPPPLWTPNMIVVLQRR